MERPPKRSAQHFSGMQRLTSMVGAKGLEPLSQKTADFKSAAYANSATPPLGHDEHSTRKRHIGYVFLSDSSTKTTTYRKIYIIATYRQEMAPQRFLDVILISDSNKGSTSSDPCPKKGADMQKYICDVCGYVYDPQIGDPDGGIDPGTPFEDIPDDWVCPICGVSKEDFSPLD